MQPGTLLADRYLLGEELGSGGMGSVYRATDQRTGGLVAVKVPHPQLARDPIYRARLRREAELAAALSSPRVVRVIDFFEHAGTPVLVLEYVGGETLQERLQREGRLPVTEALSIMLEITRALEAAHARGIEHRDLKPQNVKLIDGQVKVLDFGLARAEGGAALTLSGAYLGTPEYSAPERIYGEGDVRSDLYSLGVILYQLLEGRLPFDAATPMAMLRQHEIESPPPLTVTAFARVQSILDRCLAKPPEVRYQVPRDLAAALEAALANSDPSPVAAATVPLSAPSIRSLQSDELAPRFDLFLSHDSSDEPLVERLALQLRQAGVEPWLGAWQLAPDGARRGQIARGVRDSAACAVFVGTHGPGDWSRPELELALERAATDRDFRLFSVLLPGLAEPLDATGLPPSLSTRTWVDLRGGAEDARAVRALVGAARGVPLGTAVPAASRDNTCPYRGLQPFDEDNAEFFFGRDADIQRLLERLKAGRFLAVIGPSGNGKSSLARAGLIPALRAGGLPGSADWKIRAFTPGSSPLAMLGAQLLRLFPGEAMQRTLDLLASDPRTLHLAVALAQAERPGDERVVWVIDQCEEVFTLCRDEREREAFFANLLYACSIPDGRNVVVLTLRADFYPRCAAHAELSARIGAQQFLVAPMDAEGIRQVVEEPARRVGLEFEAGLVETILDDVASQPGALPLLEHALLELWERRRGSVLTLEAYRASGGVQGALARRADAIYLQLNPEQQRVARRVLLRLTQPGEGTEDTRRRASFRELITRTDEAAVEAVVRELADARLLTTGADGRGEATEATVDIAHEALIRNWPRLRQWIDEDRAALRTHRQLTDAGREWERLGRDEGLLYRGARLAEAADWRTSHDDALNDLERAFLDASAALQSGERAARERLRRRVTGAAVGVALFFVVLTGVAGLQWLRAEEQLRAAVGARGQAEAQGEAAELARGQAEAQGEAAELARGQADVQRQAAEGARNQALEQQRLAIARQLAAQAEALRTQQAGLLPRSVLLAVEAMLRLPSPEATYPLRHGLAILPRSLAFADFDHPLDAVAFSPDGTLVAAAEGDVLSLLPGRAIQPRSSVVHLIETISGREVAAMVHEGDVVALAFSPDGRFLATASADRTAGVWEVPTGREVAHLRHGELVTRVAFSPDSLRVATASWDGTARIWEVNSGREMLRLEHDHPVVDAAFSPDGSRLATASAGIAAIWDVTSGGGIVEMEHEDDVIDLAYSPDGRWLTTASSDGAARVWEVQTGRLGATMKHRDDLVAVAYSPEGSLLATTSLDATARVWEAASGREVARLAHQGTVLSVAFSPDGTSLATASDDRTARIWEIATGRELARIAHDDLVYSVDFSTDGRVLATASRDLTLRLWEATSRPEFTRLSSAKAMNDVAFSADGRFVATASDDSTARVWEVASGREVVSVASLEVVSVALSPNGSLLATASADSTARVWQVATGHEIARMTHDNELLAVAFSPDGRYLATGSLDTTARLWELPSGREIGQMSHDREVGGVAFSSDGTLLATASLDGNARVWDVSSLRERVRMTQGSPVHAVAFSLDGMYLATGSGDHTARVWEVASGHEVARMTHHDLVTSVAFSPDGRYLASTSNDRSAQLWLLRPRDLIDEACARLTRNLSREEWVQYVGDEPYRATCPNQPASPS